MLEVKRVRRGQRDGTRPCGCPVELTAAVARHAGQLAGRHALRGADAVHLASALAVADSDLILAIWDRRLHAGAVAAGLRLAPAQLGPAGPG